MASVIIRTMDIIFSFLGLCVLSPLLLMLLILGLLDTGSPLFIQSRVGKNMQIFPLVKFRTMNRNTESVATHLVQPSSVTGLGTVLRKYKLDELPQLINVLLGHMSLVGPRPCLPNQLHLIQARNAYGVFKVRPGITGLSQIHEIDMSTPKKLARYDTVMLKHLDLCTYFSLIIMTLVGRGTGDRVRAPSGG